MISESATRFAGRYLFVAGLHRSGTSLLTRLIAQHPQIAAITRSPAPEDEGCYLQGAIPHTAQHGRPGHYATDPAQHLVEGCVYDRLETRRRMEADWNQWFAVPADGTAAAQWRIEKSPVNLTRMRLYQQLFPMAQFVIILRHPQALALAMEKWVDAPFAARVEHVLSAYEQLHTDLAYLHHACVVRYEDLVRNGAGTIGAIHQFMALKPCALEAALRDGNADYPDTPALTAPQQERCARWGYGPHNGVAPWPPIVAHPLRAQREATLAALAASDAAVP